MSDLITLLLKLPRNTTVTPEAAQTFFATLTQINPTDTPSLLKLLFNNSGTKSISLEIALINGQVQFQLTSHAEFIPFIETQIHSNYPLTLIEKVKDPLTEIDVANLQVAYFKLKQGDFYPLATFPSFTDVDPLSSVLSVLAKAPVDQFALVQYTIEGVSNSWQAKGKGYAEYGTKNENGTYSPRGDANIIKEKIAYPGFRTSIRVATNSVKTLYDIVSAYDVFTKSDGNSLVATYPDKGKLKTEIDYLQKRKVADKQVINIQELATLWHLPSEKIKTPSIAWGTSVLSEPPHNLPISLDISPADKSRINFFGRTVFKNKDTTFGIKDKDRLRHIWTVGKTGTGKSTMIANMAIDDVKKDRGIAIIDPHGDLCEDVLDYIPASRINETIYFNPADKDFPIVLNPLEVTNREEAELVVAGLMSIFTKVWANVWSARMEYILRNSFLTLTEIPDSTLADVLKLLADQSYRNRIVSRITDQTLVHFWKNEFDAMPDTLQKEAISPIQNKVGQFVTSPMIRRIIGTPRSSISIDKIMNEKKILLVNLSQGRLGEDNSALLGAMLITKFQLAAMHRVDIPKEERVPFYLYVDEFQNFATDSFIKILSEARKYGLALLLANQYMAQIPEGVSKAILGNAGTMISFAVGADDAAVFHREFAEVFTENDLVNLENYQIAIKLMVDSHSTRPFLAKTLPLPESKNQNREKVIRVSRERWTKAAKEPGHDTLSKDTKEELQEKGPEENTGETLYDPKVPETSDLTHRLVDQFAPLPPIINSQPTSQAGGLQRPEATHHPQPNIPSISGEKDLPFERFPEVKEQKPRHTQKPDEAPPTSQSRNFTKREKTVKGQGAQNTQPSAHYLPPRPEAFRGRRQPTTHAQQPNFDSDQNLSRDIWPPRDTKPVNLPKVTKPHQKAEPQNAHEPYIKSNKNPKHSMQKRPQFQSQALPDEFSQPMPFKRGQRPLAQYPFDPNAPWTPPQPIPGMRPSQGRSFPKQPRNLPFPSGFPPAQSGSFPGLPGTFPPGRFIPQQGGAFPGFQPRNPQGSPFPPFPRPQGSGASPFPNMARSPMQPFGESRFGAPPFGQPPQYPPPPPAFDEAKYKREMEKRRLEEQKRIDELKRQLATIAKDKADENS